MAELPVHSEFAQSSFLLIQKPTQLSPNSKQLSLSKLRNMMMIMMCAKMIKKKLLNL